MSQPVRPHGRQPSTAAGSFHNVTDQICPDRSSRGPAGQKQPPGIGWDPVPGQVGDQGFADLPGEREPVLATALATDDELTRAPVDVLQFQPCDLDGPQPQPCDQPHDREVADPDVGRAVATVQQGLDVGGADRGRRQRGEPPTTDRWDGCPQPQWRQALQVEETQDSTQLCDATLG